MRAVAVDPGKVCGLAWWDRALSDEPYLDEGPLWATIRQVHLALERKGLDAIVVEDFVITALTARKTSDRSALDGLGALRYLAWAYGIPLILQRPAQAKTFATDAALRRVGWYRPGRSHARDASRHLLLFLVDAGVIPPERVIRPVDGRSEPSPGASSAPSDGGAG